MEGRSEEERIGERTLIIIFLQIAELTLREMLENQPLQFEVAMHGQHKTYKFQACACECVCLSVLHVISPLPHRRAALQFVTCGLKRSGDSSKISSHS